MGTALFRIAFRGGKITKNRGESGMVGRKLFKNHWGAPAVLFIGSALRAEILQNLYRIKQNLGRSPGRDFLYIGALTGGN